MSVLYREDTGVRAETPISSEDQVCPGIAQRRGKDQRNGLD
jgi:hypothetical protein